jgi:hypothetical protein
MVHRIVGVPLRAQINSVEDGIAVGLNYRNEMVIMDVMNGIDWEPWNPDVIELALQGRTRQIEMYQELLEKRDRGKRPA